MENKRKYSMKSDAKQRRARVISRHEPVIDQLKKIKDRNPHEEAKLVRLEREVEVLKTRI